MRQNIVRFLDNTGTTMTLYFDSKAAAVAFAESLPQQVDVMRWITTTKRWSYEGSSVLVAICDSATDIPSNGSKQH